MRCLTSPTAVSFALVSEERGSHELVLVPGGVLELVEEDVAVGLAEGALGVWVVLQDLECKWNEVSEGDLLAVDAGIGIDAIVGLQLVLAGQGRPVVVDQSLGEGMECEAVEPCRVLRS